jgi:predicted RNA methylase
VFRVLSTYGFPNRERQQESVETLREEFRALVDGLPNDLPITYGSVPNLGANDFVWWEEQERRLLRFFASHLAPAARSRLQHIAEEGGMAFPVNVALKSVLLDLPRTKSFSLGVREAVHDLAERIPADKPIRVLEAGCGGIPILAISAALANPRVRVTCLELDTYAAAMAQEMVASLGLQEQITIIQGDATRHEFPKDTTFDLIISETFDAALQAEPIHAIMRHLKRYAREGTIQIPESITMSGMVVSANEPSTLPHVHAHFPPGNHSEPRSFELIRKARRHATEFVPGGEAQAVEVRVPFPKGECPDPVVLLFTMVDVYDGRQLGASKSFATRLVCDLAQDGGDADSRSVRIEGNDVVVRIIPGMSLPNAEGFRDEDASDEDEVYGM